MRDSSVPALHNLEERVDVVGLDRCAACRDDACLSSAHTQPRRLLDHVIHLDRQRSGDGTDEPSWMCRVDRRLPLGECTCEQVSGGAPQTRMVWVCRPPRVREVR